MIGSRESLLQSLKDKEFRDEYVAEHITTGIAFQIRALREKEGWSQAELGRRANKPQSVISRIEDPDYGKLSLQTLKDVAATFDVALLVRFVPFSELLAKVADLSPQALAAASFSRDKFDGRSADDRLSAASALVSRDGHQKYARSIAQHEDSIVLRHQQFERPTASLMSHPENTALGAASPRVAYSQRLRS